MSRAYANQRFGRLVLVSKAHIKNRHRHWNCLCDCGNNTIVSSSNLRRGATKSCGCLSKERLASQRKKYGEASFNAIYRTYKASAAKKNIDFLLTEEEFRNITSSNCDYCGQEPKQFSKKREYGSYVHNGIDRVDNKKPYESSNCVACCKTCNYMKLLHSKEFFLEHVRKIYNHLNR